jgi:hypothetical protein
VLTLTPQKDTVTGPAEGELIAVRLAAQPNDVVVVERKIRTFCSGVELYPSGGS